MRYNSVRGGACAESASAGKPAFSHGMRKFGSICLRAASRAQQLRMQQDYSAAHSMKPWNMTTAHHSTMTKVTADQQHDLSGFAARMQQLRTYSDPHRVEWRRRPLRVDQLRFGRVLRANRRQQTTLAAAQIDLFCIVSRDCSVIVVISIEGDVDIALRAITKRAACRGHLQVLRRSCSAGARSRVRCQSAATARR